MNPFITCSFGGRLNYITGARVLPFNNTLLTDPSITVAVGSADPENVLVGSTEWNEYMFGGRNTCWPGGYANHKPGAFYRGKFYQSLYDIRNDQGRFYITRFDGSGIFRNQGNDDYDAAPWKNGRGTELISPSGSPNFFFSQELAHLTYNNTVYIAGCMFRCVADAQTSSWVTKFGWDFGTDENTALTRAARLYKLFTVQIDDSGEKRIAIPCKRFLPDATNWEDTHACDMIGFKNDVYFASNVDILKFPGGSGQPELIENNNTYPSAKSFAIFPASGYNGVVPSGISSVFCLTGSGSLKMLLSPSGTETVFDVKYLNSDVRTGNTWTRSEAGEAEPGRSSLLIPFNRKLHAFVITATSGYRHYVLNGQPRNSSHWTEQSTSLPVNMRLYDGNVFGFVDERKDKMYIMHSTMSEVGLWGYQGAQKGAGGIYVYEYNSNENWRTITETMVGEAPRGAIPYNNLGPYATVPSGSNPTVHQANDYAIVNYTLFDHFSRNVDVDLEFSIDDGVTWGTARRFKSYDTATLLGSGIVNLPTSPIGINYDFYWDYVNDVGFNVERTCLLRVLPRFTR